MQSKLQQIASSMRATIAGRSKGWIDYALPGGLEIVLSHNGEKWRLALRRENVFPSETEVSILSRTFAVAEGVEPVRRITGDAHPVTHRRIEWRIVELNWIEIAEPVT